MTTAAPKGIYQKIAAIQRSVPTLQKNGVGPATQGSYKFLAVDDVLSAIRPLLDEYGVIVVPTLLDHGFHYNAAALKEDGRVPKENVHAWVKYKFDFIDTDGITADVPRTASVTVIGEGIDSQDKAIRKATTSVWKIALIQTFALITGELDPDAQDGGSDAQSTAPNSGSGTATRALNAALNVPARGVDPEAERIKGEIRATYVDTGKLTTTQLNALSTKVLDETGHSKGTVENLTEVASRLAKGEVA